MEEEKKEVLEEKEETKEEQEEVKEEKEEKEEAKEEKIEDSKLVKAFTDTKDSTGEFDKKDIEDNSVMGLLSYLWILWLIPLLAAKNSKFARFHANQGLVLFILEVLGGTVFGVLTRIDKIGGIFWALFGIFEFLCLILAVLGIVNSVQGQAKELPLIGKFKLLDYNKVTAEEKAEEEEKKEETEE